MPLRYDEPLWRPPSEARSFIVQATLGCSHNRCTFCTMYKSKRFRVRPMSAILADLDEGARAFPMARRIFLADGDAAVLSPDKMLSVLAACKDRFPKLERVSCYATPQNLIRKSLDDLRRWREAGLTLMYYGVESGHPGILSDIHKGAGPEEILEGGLKARRAGIALSCTVILGLAGPERSQEHAQATGELLSALDPEYASALTLMIPDPEMLEALGLQRSFFENSPAGRMPPWDILQELRNMLAAMDVSHCVFRSNHASNYLPIKAELPQDKGAVLATLQEILDRRPTGSLRPESWRGL